MIGPILSAVTAFVTIVSFAIGVGVGWMKYSRPPVETKIVYCYSEADCQRVREEQVRMRGSLPSGTASR